MRPVTLNPDNVRASLKEIEAASHDNDVVDVAMAFAFDTTFTSVTALLVGTPSLSNTNAVLATLLETMQKGGFNRTT